MDKNFDYTITIPPQFTFIPPSHLPPTVPRTIPFSETTLKSMDPRNQSSQNIADFFSHAWKAILNFFKSCLSCFGLFSKPILSPSERENRLPQTANIDRRLVNQMQRSQRQMEQEPVKGFQYTAAPAQWDAHDEIVGGMPVGYSHIQGRRPEMEDEHLAISFPLNVAGRNYPVKLFGIFDGHGGPMAARYVRDNLQRKLQETLIEYNQEGLTDAGIWKALKMTCVRLNRDFKDTQGIIANRQGTTATIAMILDNKVWTGNVGDARIALDNNGTPIQLTEDAKPSDARYRKGIENRDGQVVIVHGVPRVNGDLAVARAIGDHRLNGAISARAKITMKPLSEIQPGSHLILCCDGVYDVARTIDTVGVAHQNRALSPGNLAKNITHSAYHSGSTDNISAMVVQVR